MRSQFDVSSENNFLVVKVQINLNYFGIIIIIIVIRLFKVLTVASLTAFSGMVMRGKEYMAPCTGLHLIPSTVLRTSSVSLAFSANAFKVAVRSCVRARENTDQHIN